VVLLYLNDDYTRLISLYVLSPDAPYLSVDYTCLSVIQVSFFYNFSYLPICYTSPFLLAFRICLFVIHFHFFQLFVSAYLLYIFLSSSFSRFSLWGYNCADFTVEGESYGAVAHKANEPFNKLRSVEKWDVWPQGPRLQGEDGDKAGARESNKTTEQPNNRTLTRHRNIINTHQSKI
jgi:hypothetical protein